MTARWFSVVVLTIIMPVLAGMSPAHAATLTVDTTVDDPAATACTDAAPNDCSLRGAIIKANGLSEASTINVPAGTYVLSQPTNCPFRSHQFGNEPQNTSALCIDAEVTLIGAGAADTVIDGNQLDHVVMVSDHTVELRGVTMRNGFVVGTPQNNAFAGNLVGGGGIVNGGTLTLVDCIVRDSTTVGNGGGIYNGHSLTLLRSTVTRNAAGQSGGGIENASFFEVTPLAVLDSSIDTNRSVIGTGGAIDNFGGAVIVSGSTISGNSAPSLGGGVMNANNSGVLTVTNSTISGNGSGSAGAGIFNSHVVDLNNVTITNNSSANNGGGIYNNAGTVTLSNTLIAGNHDQFGDPDCRGSFVSQGNNLIQNASSGCQLTGDTSGDITGQDPRLGLLADNGGPSQTHALGDGSPAIDAGSPAAPGSGGAACAALDQRGFLRPLGAACDIGAFERSGSFAVSKIQPSSSGNTGSSSALVSGSGFLQGATVKLTRAGQPDIVANPLQVDVGGSAIAATFDLTGRPTGPWDVVVVNPDSTSRTLPAGFTVEAGGAPDLWVDVIGLTRREGQPSILTIIYGNRGKVDALAVPLSLSLPQGYSAAQYFAIVPPPAQPGEVRPDWNQIPPVVAEEAQNSFLQLPLLLPIVPSGYTGALSVSLTLPANAQDSSLVAAIGDPAFTGSVDSKFIADAAAGAQSYLQQIFGITLPASLVPELQQYAATQFQQVIANGRAAFTASFGTQPQVYSLAQLQLDLAFFAALRVGSAP